VAYIDRVSNRATPLATSEHEHSPSAMNNNPTALPAGRGGRGGRGGHKNRHRGHRDQAERSTGGGRGRPGISSTTGATRSGRGASANVEAAGAGRGVPSPGPSKPIRQSASIRGGQPTREGSGNEELHPNGKSLIRVGDVARVRIPCAVLIPSELSRHRCTAMSTGCNGPTTKTLTYIATTSSSVFLRSRKPTKNGGISNALWMRSIPTGVGVRKVGYWNIVTIAIEMLDHIVVNVCTIRENDE
jgi:hypothetical protein